MSSRFKKITIGLLVFFVAVSLLIISSPTALTMIGWAYVAFIMSGGAQSIDLNPDKVTDRGSYYRITAQYLVDKTEPIDFDIVTACGRSKIKTKGAEQELVLSVFAKRTRNNHAILISIPDFCSAVESRLLGQSGGEYDGSFLPFTVWFEDANNLELGLGYASLYAYESPSARLTFQNSTIRYATREEFEDWYEHQNDNLITGQMLQASPYNSNGWLLEEGLTVPHHCFGVGFINANSTAQDTLSRYWPADHPVYWSKKQIGQERWAELFKDLRSDEQARFGSYGLPPTKLGGRGKTLDWGVSNNARDGIGNNLSKLSSYLRTKRLSTEQYPVYFNDAIPLVRNGLSAPYVSASIDLRPEMKGFVSCYTRYSWTKQQITESARTEVVAPPYALDHYFGGLRQFNDFRLMVEGKVVIRSKNYSSLTNSLIVENRKIGKLTKITLK